MKNSTATFVELRVVASLLEIEPVGTRSNNGGVTKPLTDASLRVLADLQRETVPCRSVNAGVVDRLTREPDPLAGLEFRPNPFPSSRTREPKIYFLVLTDAGRQELQRRGLARG